MAKLPPQFMKKSGPDDEVAEGEAPTKKGRKKGKKKPAPKQRAAMVAAFMKGRK